MTGFARHSLKLDREQSQFLRLRRILRNCGHDLHRCPPDSPSYPERGAYYATTSSGEIASRIDLADWLADLGDPSRTVWDVNVRLVMHLPGSPIVPVEGKPGHYRLTAQEVA